MKFTRTAVALGAAALIAAGSVPAVQHFAAEGDADKPVTVLSPAATTVQTSLETPTSSTTTPTSSPTTTSERPKVVQNSTTETATTTTAADAPSTSTSTSPTATVVETTAEEEAHPNISPLGEAPKTFQGKDQRWVRILAGNRKNWDNEAISVYSESMEREIPVAIFYATDENGERKENAPTVYLLNGAGGSEQDTDWVAQAYDELEKTYKDSGANVVIPMEGAFSYYVDWAAEPPVDTDTNPFFHGKQMWSTFLAHELPQAVEPYMKADEEHRAVAGLSMAATSVLLLAEHNPGFYDAVGSFSGCAATSTPIPWEFVNLTVSRGAPNVMSPEYIFGERGSDYNRHYDALVNAADLKGTAVYLSTGTGLAGESDTPGYLKDRLINQYGVDPDSASARALSNAMTLQVEGGVIEAAMNACTHDLMVKMRANDVEVTHAELRNVGTHSWASWRDDVKLSFDKVFKEALGLEQ
ncbi:MULTISPECIES: alpha/beta hydrolase family protein [unclassified Corynebacterium]|uniref:alpha/beta hydrolase n=1 Tax=unclassified Corynebacterium TaxID=2624378 RepID=UPI001EF413A7|nr:esterase family protein [Corynebacterium sp. ACRPZ]MCG7293588.1 esterase family protein [Corynebacterium sp. ACRPY]